MTAAPIPCPHHASGCEWPMDDCVGICHRQCHRCPVRSDCSGPMLEIRETFEGGGFIAGRGEMVNRTVKWRCPTESGN